MELTLFGKLFLFYVLGFVVGFFVKWASDLSGKKALKNLIWKQQETLRKQSLELAPKKPSKRGRPKGSKNTVRNTKETVETIVGGYRGKKRGHMKVLRKPRRITEGFQVSEVWKKA